MTLRIRKYIIQFDKRALHNNIELQSGLTRIQNYYQNRQVINSFPDNQKH